MFGGLEDIIWTNTDILTLHCDLDLEWSYPFFFTRHSGLLWCIIRPSLVAKESIFREYSRKSQILIIWMSACCDFDLEDSNNKKSAWPSGSWCWFGNKMLGGLEDITWTNTDILTLHCDLDLECSYPIFFIRHSGLWWCIIRPSLVAKESTVQKI